MIAGFASLIIWFIFAVIFFFILHYVIRSAINNSEMNQTLKEIHHLLKAKKDGS